MWSLVAGFGVKLPHPFLYFDVVPLQGLLINFYYQKICVESMPEWEGTQL
jgi:hypothetical protein